MGNLERDASYAMMLELLLEKKVENFFGNPKHVAILFPIIQNENHKHHKNIYNIESLIPVIREAITKNQLKQALKLLVILDSLIKEILK